MSRRRPWQAGGALTLVVLCAGGGTAHAAPSAEPAESASCPVVAAAQSVSATVQKDGDLVLARPVGGQVPAAQVCVNAALSDSTAYASAAYPGATVVTAPGAAADFPGYVSSSYPGTPEAKADSGAFVVHARSSATSGEATAETGPPSVGTPAGHASADAKGTVDSTAGTASSRASAVSTPLAVGDVLTMGEVHSTAAATLRPDGTIERTSSMDVGRTTVAGQVVTVTASGVQAAGQDVPLPGAESATDVLAQAGITVTYLAPQKTAGGVVSAGVSISVVAQDAAGARTVTSYVLGRSFAAVSGAGATTGQDVAPGATSWPPPNVGGSPLAQSRTGSPAALPGVTPDVSGPAPSGSGSGPITAAEPSALVGSRALASLGTFYLVLVTGGLVLLVSCTSVRLLGVRTRWIS